MDVDTPRQIGESKLAVTPFGFGGGTIGSPDVANATALDTVQASWDIGVRFFDTAPWYGVGRSERRLGLGLNEADGAGTAPDPTTYAINTKIGKTLVAEPIRDDANKTVSPGGMVRTVRDPLTGFRVAFNYTYEAILRQHGDSLQRLGRSCVDSLTIHDIDYGYHDEAQLELHLQELSANGGGGARALYELRDAGLIKAIGCGCNLESRNADSWLTHAHEDLIERMADLVDLDFLIVAGGYTLLETRALRRVLPLCEARGIGVIIAAPYASGWLVAPDIEGMTYMYAQPPEEIVQRSQGMQAVCEAHGVPLAAAAIQFPLAHSCVAAVIPGAKSPEEVQQNHAHLHTKVPTGMWDDLRREGLIDEAAPTPG